MEKTTTKDGKQYVMEMDVDEALEDGGPCGISQTVLQILFMAACVTISYHATGSYFIGHNPSWKCVSGGNSTFHDGGRHNGTKGVGMSAFCRQYFNETISSDDTRFYKRCNLPREEWTYTTSKTHSYVTEFDLVCDRAVVAALVGGMFFVGGMVGCLITGIISDMYGRKSVMIASQILVIVSCLACSYSANVWQLTGARVILGGAQMASFTVGYTAILEYVAPSYRTLCGMIYQMMFGSSQLFFDVAAYFYREWRGLQFYSSFACVLSLLLFFLAPNTPRWLLSAGRFVKAKKVLKDLAKYNRSPLPEFNLKAQMDTNSLNEENYTYLHLFKTWKVFSSSVVLSYIWVVCALLYFAIALESSNLGGNMYQAFALTCIADLPSYVVSLFACNIFGRKKTVLGSLFCAGIFIGCCSLVPQTYKYKYIFNIVLAMLAKFCTTNAFNSIFLWTFEIYPTVLRSQGTSFCVAWERLGAFCAPFLIRVLQRASYILPYLIMSAAAVLCVLCGLILPETKDMPTRESYEDFFKDTSDSHSMKSTTMEEKPTSETCGGGTDNRGLESSDV